MATEREASDMEVMYDEFGSSQTPPPTFPVSTRSKTGSRDRSSSVLALASCCIGNNTTDRIRNRSQKSQKSSSLSFPNDHAHNRSNRQRQSTIPETDIESQPHETINLHEPHQVNNTAHHEHHETVAKTKDEDNDETSIV